jgi:hypothetical protein
MRSGIIVGVFVLVGLVGAGTIAAGGTSYVGSDKQWTIANFPDPVLVKGVFIMGPVLVVHDSTKMARGEACSTFYRFDPSTGATEALASFHCRPKAGDTVEATTFTTVLTDSGCKRLVAYQIAGDSEAHALPAE